MIFQLYILLVYPIKHYNNNSLSKNKKKKENKNFKKYADNLKRS